MSSRPKALVSGCYDLLHAGHVTFFETAAQYGDLYVCIGSDENVRRLKDHAPKFTQDERLYLVRSIRCVTEARISSGSGMLDFEPEMAEIRPEFFVVNEDGASEEKRRLCEKYGARYVVLPRTPKPGLPARSSTAIKAELEREPAAEKGAEEGAEEGTGPICAEPGTDRRLVAGRPSKLDLSPLPLLEKELPYRICLAGGWMDQPWVSKYHPGSVVVINIHPTREFNLRSGMATSTRNLWQRLQKYNLFPDDPVELARLLFGYENPPGTKYVSGSQDHLGLTLPGANRLYYNGEHWPERIESTTAPDVCDWLEQSIALVELFERPPDYDPLARQNITTESVARLGKAGDRCWEAILAKDIRRLGEAVAETHKAWGEILPLTTSDDIEAEMAKYPCYGRITSGSGGGYLVLVTDEAIPNSFRIQVRRSLEE